MMAQARGDKDSDITAFRGDKMDIFWDRRLCIHVEECVRAEGSLFVEGRRRWCKPNESTVKDAVDIIRRCPTGALTFKLKENYKMSEKNKENNVTVSGNGPLLASGELNIEDAPTDMKGVKERAALCRCGQSKNKPFCDGSHIEAGFTDPGAVGEKGTLDESPDEVMDGELKITASQDGPLLFTGKFQITSGSGSVAWKGGSSALCRCGHSKNKPFCDGSHKEVGFKS